MYSRKVANKVGKLVGNSLRERFKEEFVLGPILVEPAVDHDGEEYLGISIICEGGFRQLDPDWSSKWSLFLPPGLLDLSVTSVPYHRFVPNSGWQEVLKVKHPGPMHP